MTIDEELQQLETLKHVGRALADFVRSLPPSVKPNYCEGEFKRQGKKWVHDPNFVTFTLHYIRTENITLSLRGNPSQFQQSDVLPLQPGRGAKTSKGGYSECRISGARQLGAAAVYIERAYEIYRKGRGCKHRIVSPTGNGTQ